MADDVQDKTETLFDLVKEITGLEPEEEESVEDYKGRVVRYFSDLDDDAYDAAVDGRDDLAVWVKNATTVYKANRGAGKPKPLPALVGLPGDTPAATKPARASRSRVKDKEAGEGGEDKSPFTRKELAATFEPAPENANVSKLLVKPLRAAGFRRQKERSEAGHIVYSAEDGREIHIGPGKTESKYLMGWRPKGETQHRYGGPALEEYLGA